MSLPQLLRSSLRPAVSLSRWTRSLSSTSVLQNGASSTAPEHVLSSGESVIAAKLREKFKPSRLDVEDVSGGCGTFYAITIQSSAFVGLPTVQQHRLVNAAIKEDIAGIHGLQLKTIPDTPSL